jgi:hypothetical protein
LLHLIWQSQILGATFGRVAASEKQNSTAVSVWSFHRGLLRFHNQVDAWKALLLW